MKLKLIWLLAGASLFLEISVNGAATNWSILKHIPIGGEGGWDYVALEPETNGFLSAMQSTWWFWI